MQRLFNRPVAHTNRGDRHALFRWQPELAFEVRLCYGFQPVGVGIREISAQIITVPLMSSHEL